DPRRAYARWRVGRDELFRSHPQSPLPPGDPLRATGLPYWPYDPAFRFEVPMLPPPGPAELRLPTGADGTTTLILAGPVELPPAAAGPPRRLVAAAVRGRPVPAAARRLRRRWPASQRAGSPATAQRSGAAHPRSRPPQLRLPGSRPAVPGPVEDHLEPVCGVESGRGRGTGRGGNRGGLAVREGQADVPDVYRAAPGLHPDGG